MLHILLQIKLDSGGFKVREMPHFGRVYLSKDRARDGAVKSFLGERLKGDPGVCVAVLEKKDGKTRVLEKTEDYKPPE